MLQNNIGSKFQPYVVPGDLAHYIELLTEQSRHLWHIVTGYDNTVFGNSALQTFYTAQTGSSFSTAKVAEGLLSVVEKTELNRLAYWKL